MIRIVSCYLFPLVWFGGAHGHALWQQVVQAEKTYDSESSALATVFTFAEKPGLANVEAERMATMAQELGVFTYIQGADDDFYPLTQMQPGKAGKFLTSDLPAAGTSFMLESVFFRGLYGHGDGKPSNIVFYTGAYNYGIKSIQEVLKLSKNKLRLFLVDVERAVEYNVGGFYESTCEGRDLVCVAAEATFEEDKLFNTTIKVVDGESGQEIDTKYTNVGGLAYFSFPKTTTSRIFAKVSHQVSTPGSVSRDGKSYDDTHHIATTVMELTPNYPQYPADATTATTLVATIQKYPDADVNGEAPQGSVSMFFDDNGDVMINVDANYLSQSCSEANTNKNGCGIHVHSGKTCDEADLVEGHYYPKNLADDPWSNVRYSSDIAGLSTSRVTIKGNGYGAADTVGRVVVFHDPDGGRIACGILEFADEEAVKDVVEEAIANVMEKGTTSTSASENSSNTNSVGGLTIGYAILFFFTVLLASFLGGVVSAKLVANFGSPYRPPSTIAESGVV